MTDTKQDMHAELMTLAEKWLAYARMNPANNEHGLKLRAALDAYARTLTDRIAELEAQLEAVGAGGVGSGIVSLVGWQFVPTEDTPSMWTAGGKAIKNCAGHSRDAASLAYKAMLAAAPQPQQAAEPAGQALGRIAEKLKRAGASVPAPENKGSIESAMATGLSIALLLVQEELEATTPKEQS